MNDKNQSNNAILYRVGIDVGTHSTGFFAVEVDDADFPISILNSVVFVHDSGIDPGGQKQAITRLATAGVKRRTRRMIRRRKQRLAKLDQWITSQNWPLVDLEAEKDPYLPWLVRARLAEAPISNPQELQRSLSIALRHMARHRGWRNPYSKITSLYITAPQSEQLSALRKRIEETTGQSTSDQETPAQLVTRLELNAQLKLRGEAGILGGKLMQSDNAEELRRIVEVQGLSPVLLREMIDQVFFALSPRGSAVGRIGKDALPGQENKPRANKADECFQKFRIATVVANLRILTDDHAKRRLTAVEQSKVVNYLMTDSPTADRVSWNEVAELLAVERDALAGTATTGPDGERPSAFPPVNVTDQKIRQLKIPAVVNWWNVADQQMRAVFVSEVSNAGDPPHLRGSSRGC